MFAIVWADGTKFRLDLPLARYYSGTWQGYKGDFESITFSLAFVWAAICCLMPLPTISFGFDNWSYYNTLS